MTFSALAQNLANPSALVRFVDASGTTPGVGNYAQWATQSELIGSSGVTISTGQITLPQGYYWLIEAMLQTQLLGGGPFSSTRVVEFEVYDVTNTASIGSLASLNDSVWSGAESNQLYSRDECSRCWVDTQSASRIIAVKQTAITGYTIPGELDYDSFSAGQDYSGQSRLFCWRFD